MSVLIENMEPPKNCERCQLRIGGYCGVLQVWIDEDDFQTKPEWCPLKEVVHCGDCKWYENESVHFTGHCKYHGGFMPSDDWFCKDGERREDED